MSKNEGDGVFVVKSQEGEKMETVSRSVSECAVFSGGIERVESRESWINFVRTKSGAEATAVQTLREFRSAFAGV